MKKIIFCSLIVMLSGCISSDEPTQWVKQTNIEKNKQETALTKCKTLASEKAGQSPVRKDLPNCSTKYDSSCSFSRGKVKAKNIEAQDAWQHTFDSVVQSCMDKEGYSQVDS